MGQRVNVTQAAKITGRSEKTIRTWLQLEPPPLTIVYGPHHGGRRSAKTGKVTKGRTRWLDLDELRRLHEEQGGTEWHTEHLPRADEIDYAHELEELRADGLARAHRREGVRDPRLGGRAPRGAAGAGHAG